MKAQRTLSALVAVLVGVAAVGILMPAPARANSDPGGYGAMMAALHRLAGITPAHQAGVPQSGQWLVPPPPFLAPVGASGTGGISCRTRRIPGVEVHSNCVYLIPQVAGHVDDIRRVYTTAMGYGPDPWTLAYWVDQYEFYNGNSRDPESMIPRIQAAGGLAPGVDPAVARATPAYVDSLYRELLGRPSDPGGQAWWVARLEIKITGLVLNEDLGGLTPAEVIEQMNASPDSLASQERYRREAEAAAAEAAAYEELVNSPGYQPPDSGGY